MLAPVILAIRTPHWFHQLSQHPVGMAAVHPKPVAQRLYIPQTDHQVRPSRAGVTWLAGKSRKRRIWPDVIHIVRDLTTLNCLNRLHKMIGGMLARPHSTPRCFMFLSRAFLRIPFWDIAPSSLPELCLFDWSSLEVLFSWTSGRFHSLYHFRLAIICAVRNISWVSSAWFQTFVSHPPT